MKGVLGYVFWHYPLAGVAAADYESSLQSFRSALALHPPAGFRGSLTFAIPRVPWLEAESAYEDWYEIDDFTSLGVLNEAAVSTFRKMAHDDVARMASGGAGGVYRLISGSGALRAARYSIWIRKPAGTSYPRFYEDMSDLLAAPHVSLWQRQLTLGPATEFCLHSEEELTLPPDYAPLTLTVRVL